jgi:membrane protein DedA with SNARE-associated domain
MDGFYALIENYGYLIVFLGVVLGTMGIPFPSAAILLTAGVLVQQDQLGLRGAIVFGILGAIVGNQIGYWIGYQAGRPFVLKWGRHVKLTPERLEWVERLFARHGGKAVFAGRSFSDLRVLEALVAGTSRMHWGTFAFYSVLGGRRWATAVVYAGYWGTTTPRVGAIRSLGPDCLSPSCPTARDGVELLARLPVGDLPQESIGLS